MILKISDIIGNMIENMRLKKKIKEATIFKIYSVVFIDHDNFPILVKNMYLLVLFFNTWKKPT